MHESYFSTNILGEYQLPFYPFTTLTVVNVTILAKTQWVHKLTEILEQSMKIRLKYLPIEIFEIWKESKMVQNYTNLMKVICHLLYWALSKHFHSMLCINPKQWCDNAQALLNFFVMCVRDAQWHYPCKRKYAYSIKYWPCIQVNLIYKIKVLFTINVYFRN